MESNNNSSLTRVVAVLGAAAIVVGVWYISSERTGSTGQESDGAVRSDENRETIEAGTFQRDSDSDGLRDWEESLWGTEIENADTDGDGMSDGDEVAANRDPLTPGPNDTLERNSTPAYAKSESELNTSEAFQRDFMERLATLNQTEDVTEEEMQELVMQLSNEYFSESAEVVEKYARSDIKITNSSEVAIRDYVNAVGGLTLEYREVFSAEKLLVIRQVFNETAGNALEEAGALMRSLGSLEEELAALEIPGDLAKQHINALNGIATMRSALGEMITTRDSDPLQSVIGLNSFRSGFISFEEGITRIQEYVDESGITFASDSSASVFLSI